MQPADRPAPTTRGVTMRVTTDPPPREPSRRLTTCPVCQQPTLARGRQRYCSPACKQAAYRHRQPDPPSASPITTANSKRAHTIYQCPECETRHLNLQRCPDCQLFCRRLGSGGPSPCCEELILVEELLPDHDTPSINQPTKGAAMP